MKVAVAQINPSVGDVQGNKEKIIEQISVAACSEADIVVFGEMALTGAPLFDMPRSGEFIEKLWLELSEIAEYAKKVDVLIGLPAMVGDEVFSAAVHISKGEIVAEFHKAMVMNKEEKAYISGVESEAYEAEEPLVNIINVKNENMLVAIGDDLSFIDELECLTAGARPYIDAVVHMDSTAYYHNVGYKSISTKQAIARKINKTVISANLVGASGGVIYYGNSTVIDASGNLIVHLRAFVEEMAVVDTDVLEEYKAVPVKKLSPKGKSRETYEAIVLGLRDFMRKRNFSKAVIGLSGGVDSAVVLPLAVEALGAANVVALLMPSEFSSDHSVTDAQQLAINCGVEHHILPIKEAYNAVTATVDPLFKGLEFGLAEENIQSRLRTVLLMAYSNKFGHILINTSNKSEAAMGYGTLYGDTSGALSLMGDLYKYEVYDLARYINRDTEIIPNNILVKAPSAELRPNQKDSDSLPDYPVLDKVLYAMIEENKSINEIIEMGYEEAVVNKIAHLLKVTEHKRHQLPPALRLSVATLGVDRVFPF